MYRLLEVGEIVEDEDQEYNVETHDWDDVSVEFIGEAVQEYIDPPVRREMKYSPATGWVDVS